VFYIEPVTGIGLWAIAASSPGRTAVIDTDGRAVSYAELAGEADRYGRGLHIGYLDDDGYLFLATLTGRAAADLAMAPQGDPSRATSVHFLPSTIALTTVPFPPAATVVPLDR
jgi:hypothetical protein